MWETSEVFLKFMYLFFKNNILKMLRYIFWVILALFLYLFEVNIAFDITPSI